VTKKAWQIVFLVAVSLYLGHAGTSRPFSANTKPAIGNINGVKIAVPQEYLDGWVQYEGQEPLDPIPIKTPTFDTRILDFAILVRLSNFQPIRTAQDKSDYYQATSKAPPPDFSETWTTVDFQVKPYQITRGNFKQTIYNWENVLSAGWGPFIKQKQRVSGLVHEDSVKSYDPKAPCCHSGHFDFFYDEKTLLTFILLAPSYN
jgi:hypothetical protein